MKISKTINKDKLLFGILLLSMCFQKIEIITFGSFGLKLFHIIGFLYLPLLLKKFKHIKLPSKILTIFLIFMICVSVINSIDYGVNSLNFNYLFVFYIMLLIYNCTDNISKDDWIDLIKKVAIILLISVYINAIINYKAILKFLHNPNGHPWYDYIFNGGANLEATWIGLLGLFFKSDKKGYIYIAFCSIISALVASRVGILIDVFVFIFLTLASFDKNKWSIKRDRILIMIMIATVMITFFVQTGTINYLLERMQSIGKDPGSTGRINMWEDIYTAILFNPFGYGVGNATKALNIFSETYIPEDNVHNLYFQMFLDLGIIGGAIFLGIVIYFFNRNWQKIFYDSIIAFLIAYFLFGLLQFRGGEAITYYILGIYFVCKRNEEENNI